MSKKDKRYLGKVEYNLLGANRFKVSMESTDFQLGGPEHGGETTVTFENVAATHWQVDVIDNYKQYTFGTDNRLKTVTLTFQGDEEMRNFYQSIVLIKDYLDEVLK